MKRAEIHTKAEKKFTIMLFFGLLVLSATASASSCPIDPTFPSCFKLGASTAAYQIEGAWNVSDKSVSIWDNFTHRVPRVTVDNSTGDVACDSYNLWQRDVEMAAEMGLDYYRFSISWPRLLPKGYDYYVSKDGAEYYNNLINGLLERGIEPVVTLYHWDLPDILQQLGGWTNPLTADWFANYARIVFDLYGDRVKTWITINEPIVVCDAAYAAGYTAPGIKEPYSGVFVCTKNVLLGHAKAWRIYDKEFRHLYDGKVSISNHMIWFEPKTKADEALNELAMQYINGRYAHAIYSEEGGWPSSLEKYMAEYSAKQGYPRSRLPVFTEYEKTLVRGTFDFIAVNYYTTKLIRPAREGEVVNDLFVSGIPDLNAVMESPPTATYGYSTLMSIYPKGLRRILGWLKDTYGDHEMMLTENGFSSSGSELNDQERIDFIRNHLEQLLLAMKVDHINVSGYTHWSLMDNFEWLDGYTSKFGLYEVNFTDPMRERTPRASANYYSKIIKQRKLDICC
ncbi:myrosinase 1 [Manduca sexta]|uniref:myrosinase 1 n=1 Tax=Manduca sexta TaxID=7130 RepID=UPI00188E1CB3|nr:myrosinase 1 [Manduca sexta]